MLAIRGFHLGPFARPARAIRHRLPPVNFITVHYMYFITTCLISAVIFWGSSTPAQSVSFTDSLFLTVSAMTLAGLNTVNLSTLNTWQQFMLFMLIMLGSAIFVSAFVVHVRRKSFERKFRAVADERRGRRVRRRNSSWHSLPFTRTLSRGENERATKEDSSAHGVIIDATHDTVQAAPCGVDDDEDGAAVPLDTLRGRPQTPTKRYYGPPGLDGAHDLPKTGLWSKDSSQPETSGLPERVTFSPETKFRAPSQDDDNMPRRRHRSSFLSMQGVGALPGSGLDLASQTSPGRVMADNTSKPQSATKLTRSYFPSSGFIARNSQFHGLSDSERETLGGVEYKALYWLSWLVPLYFVLWQLLGCLGLATYVARKRADTARSNGFNPWWIGAFNGVSAFNNSGMSLLDANMTAFQTSFYMLITMGLLILAGNTCYPIFLRFIIWTIWRLMPCNERWQDHKSTLQFLLDHPRRCYTNLFPARHTWWLLLVVVTLNSVDWAAFEILNIGNNALTDALPTNIRIIDGLFQAIAVRSGGFYVVAIPTLRISLQVLYVVMMYISVYPVVITMRNSNVYEERSLGVYADDPGYEQYEPDDSERKGIIWSGIGIFRRRLAGVEDGKSVFVRQQIRAQLAHDAWFLVLAVFLIMIVEGGQFEQDPATFSVFNVIFEVVSGYGCVGISVGLPNVAYSFSGGWHALSKLILCAVMLRGRHRGLPVAIDKAVLLPGEQLGRAEEEDAMIRMERAASRGRTEEAV